MIKHTSLHSHGHIKVLFLGFFVFLFFVSRIEIDLTMGKGSVAVEKFEQGYVDSSLGGRYAILAESSGSAYKHTYASKIDTILTDSVNYNQLLFYIHLLMERECTLLEIEQGFCEESDAKQLKEEMRMLQAYYTHIANGTTELFYQSIITQLTGGTFLGDGVSVGEFLEKLYLIVYNDVPGEDLLGAFVAKGISVEDGISLSDNLSHAALIQVIDQVLSQILVPSIHA